MPTFVFDKVRGAELNVSPVMASYTRIGHIDDIDLSDTPDPDALVKVLNVAGMPQFYSSLGPQSPNLKLARIRVLPSDAKVRRANLELGYETLISNLTPTAYMLRDRSYSVQEKSCFIYGPGSVTPIVVSFGDPAATAESEDGTAPMDTNVLADALWFDFNFTVRALQLTVLQVGRPSGGTQDYVNYVNDAVWPTGGLLFAVFQNTLGVGGSGASVTNLSTATGKPKGHWRLNSYASDYNRNSNMTLIQSEAISYNIKDWSSWGTLRSERTGKTPFMGLPQATRAAVITSMLAPAYSHGIIAAGTFVNGGAAKQAGIVRFGGYPVANFAGIFGF